MEDHQKNIPKPRVTLFGEDISEGADKDEVKESKKEKKSGACHDGNCCGGRNHRDGNCCGGGGLIILLAGTILLLNTLGLIPWEFWRFVWPFWPAFLIVAGIKIILGRNWFSRIASSVLAVALFGMVIVYALIHVDSPFVSRIPSGVVNFVNNFNQPNQ